MNFNTSYLNRTANKWPRRSAARPEFVVWHETASPNPNNPHGTLQYNLKASVQSSYNYLIARDGTIFHYVEERTWISYHAGLHSSARGYREWQVNVNSIGVELDGRNDGTPITAAQRDAAVRLTLYFNETHGIPLRREFHLHHKQVAPGYKSDPRGYTMDVVLQLAQQELEGRTPPPPPPPPPPLSDRLRQLLYQRVGGDYHPEWKFHQVAREQNLGVPLKLGLDFTARGQRYIGEVYSRDAIFSPHGQWGTVLRLSQVSDPQLFQALASKVYSSLGVAFNPGQAFYIFARNNKLGLPLVESLRMRVPSGAAFVTQPYAFDIIYTPIGVPESATNWGDVRSINAVLASPNPSAEEAQLANVVLQTYYSRLGGNYNAEERFWKAARQANLGLPLATPRSFNIDGKSLTCAVFAGDLLCTSPTDPNRLVRLSELS